jgi:hypothetical protein
VVVVTVSVSTLVSVIVVSVSTTVSLSTTVPSLSLPDLLPQAEKAYVPSTIAPIKNNFFMFKTGFKVKIGSLYRQLGKVTQG